MRTLLQDLAYAVRGLRSNPGFAAVAIASLALGIGANSAMFSFADAIMFRPMQVSHPSEVVNVFGSTKQDRLSHLSYPEYAQLRDNMRSVRDLAAVKTSMAGLSLSVDQVPELVVADLVSANFLKSMEVVPAFGRDFRPEEDAGAPGVHAVAIISHRAWQRRFNSDRNVLGRTVRLNGKEVTVIGVLPESFPGPDHYLPVEVFVPTRMYAAVIPDAKTDLLEDRNGRMFEALGRLQPGVEPKTATAEAAAIMSRLASAWPDTNANRTGLVIRENQARFERSPGDGMLARTLLIIVGMVLLIACGNAANLLLARATGRTREIAVRLAIGAGRLRLVRQLITENLVLAAISGAVGLLIGVWLIKALALVKFPNDLPIELTPRLDGRAIWYTALVSLASGIIFGLAPALRASRADLVPALRGVESGKPARRFTLRNTLVVGQIAFCVVTLVVGGVLVRAFMRMQTMEMGFRTEGVLLSATNPAMARYSSDRGREFYKQLLDRVSSSAGVQRAALTSQVPFGLAGQKWTGIVPEGYSLPGDQDNVGVMSDSVSPGYFDVMKLRLLRGRDFDWRDGESAARVVIVNETAAKRFWPGRDPIGARLRLENRSGDEAVVIGIASDSKYQWPLENPTPYMYRPYMQSYEPRLTLLTAAASGYDPAGLAETVRAAVKSLDANIPVFDVRTFHTFYTERALGPGRILTGMLGALGALGMALAMVGLYGVVSYAVGRRTREIGIRMAIGADSTGVSRMVLKQGFWLGIIGVAIGLALSVLVTPGMKPFLGEGATNDLLVYIAIPLILLLGTLVATYVPARRAAAIDPWIALRYE